MTYNQFADPEYDVTDPTIEIKSYTPDTLDIRINHITFFVGEKEGAAE